MKETLLKRARTIQVMVVTLLSLTLPSHLLAYDFEVDGIYYDITSTTKKTCAVTYESFNYTTYSTTNIYSGSIVIPENVNYNGTDYSVTAIDGLAFCGNAELTEVTIPKSVTSISNSAFNYCPGLAKVNITDIAAWCSIKFDFSSNPLESAHHLYMNGSEVTELVIPETVTSIGSYAFSGCAGLTSVSIPNSVITIGRCVFSDCTGLTEIAIPESVTSIGDNVFSGCTGLKEASIPNSVSEIESGLFQVCTNLTEITIPNSVTKIGVNAFSGCSSLTQVNIPNSVTSIGSSAFQDCTSLTSVTIPNSVTSIGYDAFSGCTGLTSVALSNSLKKLDYNTFLNCYNLQQVNLPESMTEIGDYAFSNCGNLQHVNLPEALTELGEWAFSGCSYLSGLLTIPAGVKAVKANAFSSTQYTVCELPSTTFVKLEGTERIGNVETIIVPSDLANTYRDSNWGEMYDFISNSGITVSVKVATPGNLAKDIVSQARKAPASVNKLIITGGQLNEDDFKVMNSNMTACFDVDMSAADCETIFDNAFSDKPVLRSIVLPNNATSIGVNAFANCTILESVTASDNMLKVGDGAFQGCGTLKKVDLGDNVTEIGNSAFYNAYNLNDFKVPSALTTIGNYAFYNAGKLESMVLGENIATIGSNAFANCNSLTEFSMPNTISHIGDGAFSYTAISDIDLSEFTELTELPASMFYGDTQLQSVVFPENLLKIGDNAFNGCSKLTSISLPETTTEIGDGAFAACRKIRNINVAAVEPPTAYKNTFKNIPNEVCTVTIPTDAFYDYLLAQYWGSFVDLKSSFDIKLDSGASLEVEVFDSEAEAEVEGEANGEALRARRVVAKAASGNALAGGSSLFVNAAKTVRFKVSCDATNEVDKVLLNGNDVIGQLVDGYLILSNFDEINTLEIKVKQLVSTSVDNIGVDAIGAETVVDVYNLSGVQVMRGVEMGSISGLTPGVYIVRTATAARKIVVK